MKFVDLFAGIGGFRLGLKKANDNRESRWERDKRISQLQPNVKEQKNQGYFRCVWGCEIDKYCRQVYAKNFGKEPEGKDIRAVNPATIPDFDLLCAGFPCQSFSIAGKRKGFSDTRGTLFFDICRILQAKRPSYFLLENVKGLLSIDEGRAFEIILESLDELGYDSEWQVLNSKYFGVPQNRERVFIVGCLRGKPRPEVFPIGESDEVLGTEPEPKDICPTITSRYYKRGKTDPYLIHNVYGGFKEKEWREFKNCSPTIRTPKGGGHLPMVMDSLHGFGYGWQGYHNRKVLKKGMIRRLTPTECERLQGFPDGWTGGVSDTQRYKMLGNAVTVNVIEFLGRRTFNA